MHKSHVAYPAFLNKRWVTADVEYEIDGGEIMRHGFCHGIAGNSDSRNPFPEGHWAWEVWLKGWQDGSHTYSRRII